MASHCDIDMSPHYPIKLNRLLIVRPTLGREAGRLHNRMTRGADSWLVSDEREAEGDLASFFFFFGFETLSVDVCTYLVNMASLNAIRANCRKVHLGPLTLVRH